MPFEYTQNDIQNGHRSTERFSNIGPRIGLQPGFHHDAIGPEKVKHSTHAIVKQRGHISRFNDDIMSEKGSKQPFCCDIVLIILALVSSGVCAGVMSINEAPPASFHVPALSRYREEGLRGSLGQQSVRGSRTPHTKGSLCSCQ